MFALHSFQSSQPVGLNTNNAVRRQQRHYWERQIRDECDFERHVDCIYYNPFKHGYVKRPIDWPFSTLHRYVQTGVLPEHWANDLALEDITCGER